MAGDATKGLAKTFTVPEVAQDHLLCSVPNVHKFIKSGELVAIRFGRRVIVDSRDLEDFLQRHRTKRAAG
jgi:excisionase family DNA binding protein